MRVSMSNKITKGYCNRCCGERSHDVLHEESTTWSEDVYGDGACVFAGEDNYELIKCRGCENVELRHTSWDNAHTDENGVPITIKNLYPPETFRSEPRWLHELIWSLPIDNNFVNDFIKEIYIALRNKSLRLAVMGIRALLEQVMIDKVGDMGSFKNHLDAFENQGFVSHSQRTILEPVLEAGHATMHRSFKPTQTDIANLMDITENIIESIYINEERASRLAKRVPARSAKPPKTN